MYPFLFNETNNSKTVIAAILDSILYDSDRELAVCEIERAASTQFFISITEYEIFDVLES